MFQYYYTFIFQPYFDCSHQSVFMCIHVHYQEILSRFSYFHKSLSHEYSIVNRHQWRFFTDTNTCTPRTSLPKHLDGEYRLIYFTRNSSPHFWASDLPWICKPTLHTIRRMGRGNSSTSTTSISIPCFTVEHLHYKNMEFFYWIHHDQPWPTPSTPNLFFWPGIPNSDKSWNSHSSVLILFYNKWIACGRTTI